VSAPLLPAPMLLDGAMGTALIARGLPAGALPEEWLLSRPEEIAAVHAEHAAAGARVLLTCTFNCAAPRLEARVDRTAIEDLCARAVGVARGASRPGGLVAGSLGPTGLHAPGAATLDELSQRYRRPLSALAAAGADLLWIESQWDLREALAALEAARAVGLPAVVTFGFPERDGVLVAPDGGRAEAFLAEVEEAGAAATGVNCVAAGPALAGLVRRATASLRIPFVAKPSPGLPGAVLAPRAFAAALESAVRAGLGIAGGCCGATGDHLRAIAAVLSTS
jgi:5-methyltetrahydrofolate--homocysteine methyltransferase